MKSRSQSRKRYGTPKSRNGRSRSIVRVAPLTYQLSPQPSPFASQKLYACHVFVDRTTATRDVGARLVTTNGA